jgi:tetratricopeptide (TPR) repeat protein
LARSCIDQLDADRTASPALAEEAFAHAQRAVELDQLDSHARVNLAIAYQMARANFEAAQVQFAKALELNPNDADAYCFQGWCHVLAGQAEQAIACTDRALRLSPFDVHWCNWAQVIAHYLARRYRDAIMALGRIPDPGCEAHAFRAACYAQLGRDADAAQAMDRFLTEAAEEVDDWPGDDPAAWREFWAGGYAFEEPGNLERLLEGFRKAGLPV